MTPEQFLEASNVSRETLKRLTVYAELLHKWQKAINLVSKSTLPDLWQRHMLDSAQLFDIAQQIITEDGVSRKPLDQSTWLDLGSGAGFPGLVLAIMGAGRVHLVESDARKCTFMHEVARQTEIDVNIHTCRIERLDSMPKAPGKTDFISARALAKTDQLLTWAEPYRSETTVCLFPKGQDVDLELGGLIVSDSSKLKKWPSRTNPDSVILQVTSSRSSNSVTSS